MPRYKKPVKYTTRNGKEIDVYKVKMRQRRLAVNLRKPVVKDGVLVDPQGGAIMTTKNSRNLAKAMQKKKLEVAGRKERRVNKRMQRKADAEERKERQYLGL